MRLLRSKTISKKYLKTRYFKGYSWHTTKWNESVPVIGKRVGIIGNGASAVQMLPSLLDEAKNVTMFQRTAHYCLPRFQSEYGAKFKRLMAIWPFGHIVRFYMYMQREIRWLFMFSLGCPFCRAKNRNDSNFDERSYLRHLLIS